MPSLAFQFLFHISHIFLSLGITILTSFASCQTVCSKENREENLEACLQATRNAMVDDSLFWFGTDYFEK